MSGVGIVGAIIIGMVAGWLAEKIMHRNHGILVNLVVGIAGAFIGSFLANTLGIGTGAGVVPSLLVATVGAILLLGMLSLIKGRRGI